jgi:hypothetical protein
MPTAPNGMVFIPPGTFTMGTTQGKREEGPLHNATLPGYYIDRTPVTNRDYLAFGLAKRYRLPSTWAKPQTANWVIEGPNPFAAGSSLRYSCSVGDVRPPLIIIFDNALFGVVILCLAQPTYEPTGTHRALSFPRISQTLGNSPSFSWECLSRIL